jgi:hypothetical protein
MRRSYFLLIFSVLSLQATAQRNQWIRFDQEYFKIPTAQDAIYRLTYDDLQNAGFPVTSVDPRALQLFHRGAEVDILVVGQEDGSFDPGDFLEFYGRRNDGTLDTELYSSPPDQPHTYYNLYSDTTSYFLTYNPAMTPSSRRMAIIQEPNTDGLPPEAYHFDEKLLVLTDSYSAGESLVDLVTDTKFIRAEGFTGLPINHGQFREYVLSDIVNTYTSGPAPRLELLVAGRGQQPHRFQVFIGGDASSLRSLGTWDFNGYDVFKVEADIDWSDIGSNGTLVIRVATLGDAENFDRVSLSYALLRYPQTITAGAENAFINLPPNAGGKSYLTIPGVPPAVRLFDVTNPRRVRLIGDPAGTVIDNTAEGRRLLLSTPTLTPAIRRVTFREFEPSDYDYIIISHKSLMKPAMGYSDVVQAYAEYRASGAGGSYRPLVVEVSELYDQFNYGEISPLAIRKFMEYLAASNLPKYLLIIGDDLDVWYLYFRLQNNYPTYKSLVPTAGYPGSDAFYTFNLAGFTNAPAVPTGRIAAMKPEEVAAYLNKVKEMESLPHDALWRKNLLHLSGGINPGEPERFRDYLQEYQATAEGLYLGGSVKWAAKQSTNPVEFININQEVNRGLNLITFFGHSASSVIDFDIGFVTDPKLGYDNKGKYPMFLINGCNAGSFFLNAKLFGEDWILAPDRGAVGFIAHTSYGLESTLHRYSTIFYEVAFGDENFIHRGVGDVQQEVAKRYMEGITPTVSHLAQVQQMLLLGDPAVSLFGTRLPDYAISEENVFIEAFDGEPVTAQSDSLALRLIIPNYGAAINDTLWIRVTRTLPDESAIRYDTLFPAVLYSDTLTVTIRNKDIFTAGRNTFTIEIDPDNTIPELNEDNNSLTFEYLLPLNRTRNLFPHNFAIVHEQELDLAFQATDPRTAARKFVVEVDTTHTFDSQWKSSFTVEGDVFNLKQVQLLPGDSLTYYWRTRLADPLPEESNEWEQSSFTYIEGGPEGWAQVHFPQFLENRSEGFVLNPQDREMGFEGTVTSVYINTFGSAAGVSNLNVSVKLNGTEYQINTQQKACRTNTINLIAFDKKTTVPYAPVPFIFQDFRTCGRQPQVINSWRLNDFYGVEPNSGLPGGPGGAVDLIAPGDSVVIFSIGNAQYSAWPADIKAKLGELGISVAQIESLQDGQPVVIFGKKGTPPGSARVYVNPSTPLNQQSLEVSATVTGRYDFGTMTSQRIGPALEWHEAFQKTGTAEPLDVMSVDLLGEDLEGNTSVLVSGLGATTDLSFVDPAQWPYLRLRFHAEDELNLTPVQLESWIVTYTPVAEGIAFFVDDAEPEILREGQVWSGTFGFANISSGTFSDSLEVQFRMTNKVTHKRHTSTFRIKPPAPGDTTIFVIEAETLGFAGANDLEIFVNPRVIPEQVYENNQLIIPGGLDVEADVFKPVLEVTFDGRVLADGDFVSANPKIVLRLWDDNDSFLKKDTLGIRMFLEYPCPPCDDDPTVYFGRPDVQWFPATETSDFRVHFSPADLPDGVYRFSVAIEDASGNSIGFGPYSITFRVQREESVLMLAPYPNPSPGFVVFTLIVSGEDAPDAIDLTVLGADGRELAHLSPRQVMVGTNEIIWDGTQDSGQLLPNGLYLYRIRLWRNGVPQLIKIPLQAKYLRGGYGKIMLLR